MIKRLIVFKILSLMFLVGLASNLFAQGPKSDHIALYVKDLKKSADFYENVMMLPAISEPFHDGKHVWLRTGEHTQLHLIEGAAAVTEHDINSHFAYNVPDLAVFTKHLDDLHVKYGNWKQDSILI